LSELVFEDSLYPKLKTEKGGNIISDTTRVIVLSGMLKRSVNESELIHLTCMNQLDKMVKQSREYIEYNVNCELINELQEVFKILCDLWKTM
jgi:hypothetical protein